MIKDISIEQIAHVHQQIAPFIHKTPVLQNQTINAMLGAEVFFKCENFQKVGAFKMRGAMNAIQQLSPEQLEFGVATHSSGNHAQALAKAAQQVGAKAYIVMPNTAPKVKRDAVLGYGANVIECEPTLQAREATLAQVVAQTKAHFIHPYDHWDIITGQATVALELMDEIERLDIIITPVGGGGLLSGTCLYAKQRCSNVAVWAGEPHAANDAYLGWQKGERVVIPQPSSIGDGLLTMLGERTFEVIHRYVDNIVTVAEKAIVDAMILVWQRMKIWIEPSSAVPLAALFKEKDAIKGKRIGVVISGGNVDFTSLVSKLDQIKG